MQQSVRKHYSQMTKEESLFLFQEALKVQNWELDGHIKKRMKERGMFDNSTRTLVTLVVS